MVYVGVKVMYCQVIVLYFSWSYMVSMVLVCIMCYCFVCFYIK